MNEDQELRDLLVRARELIAQGWCQADLATNSRGTACDYRSPNAARFCVVGALLRASRPDGRILHQRAIDHLRAVLGISPIRFNDLPTATQGDVLQLFDDAIAEIDA